MRSNQRLIVIALCALFAQNGFAAVSEQEAAQLKSTLTPFGAEKAGNKESTIPAWSGGYTNVPPGYRSGQPRPDPFVGEKKLFSIDAKNMDQYADKLSEGAKALLKKYPGSFRLDVYPTHRTAAAPQWVYDNTFRNATRAKALEGGLKIEGAYGGIPFPIPKDGREAMWNHLLRWETTTSYRPFRVIITYRNGNRAIASGGANWTQWPYYMKDGSPEKYKGFYYQIIALVNEPPANADDNVLAKDHIDQLTYGTQAWQYLAGQRRVRKAPEIAYDTPNSQAAGIANYDDRYNFGGAMDRYEWKLLGKKELYIPYNENGFVLQKTDAVLAANHLNPDTVRWELHRVWVVEATLAPGKRNVVAKRRFYLDEDTWNAVLVDLYDARGQLWKFRMALPIILYEAPAVVMGSFVAYELLTGDWLTEEVRNDKTPQWKIIEPLPESFFTPENLMTKMQR